MNGSEIDEIADGLLIKITPLRTSRVLLSSGEYTSNRSEPYWDLGTMHRAACGTGRSCQIRSFNSGIQTPQTSLSPREEEEVTYYGYKSKLPIHIPGDTETIHLYQIVRTRQ